MLGSGICEALKGFELIALKRKDLDITCFYNVRRTFYHYKLAYIINCAEYTSVDKAEDEPEKAFRVNFRDVNLLSKITKEVGAAFIHFPTDYVFDGTSKVPFKPHDSTNPIMIYGRSKLLGERSGTKYYIIRLSWLYAPHGKNSFPRMIENDPEEMKVVDNQIGAPTSVLDVAQFIQQVIQNDPQDNGIYHFSNAGSMSWFAFAKSILDLSSLEKKIKPTNHFPTAAKRPAYSVMNCEAISRVFCYKIASINEALEQAYDSYAIYG
jgi:dTDP-4-dehydrorhamnose reductase